MMIEKHQSQDPNSKKRNMKMNRGQRKIKKKMEGFSRTRLELATSDLSQKCPIRMCNASQGRLGKPLLRNPVLFHLSYLVLPGEMSSRKECFKAAEAGE